MTLRNTLVAAFCLATAVGSLSAADAAKLKPGQWDVGGIAQMCLLADGTWFGTNPINWGGNWVAVPQPNTNRYIIYGQTFHPDSASITLDSMGVLGNLKVNWTEWPFGKPGIYLEQVQMTFVKTTCDDSGFTKGKSTRAHPMD